MKASVPHWLRSWLAVLMSLAAATAGFAQSPAPQPVTPLAGRTLSLGPGDQIRIVVFQNSDLTIEQRVDGDGRLTYPFLGVLSVNGKTTTELEQLIALGLEQRGVLKRPQVSVLVTQFRSQQVAVLGNVNRPGQFALETLLTVSSALAQAGGVSVNGGDTAVLSRHAPGQPTNIEIDLVEMFTPGGKRLRDFPLEPGDVLFVHRAPLFYIYGEVQRPGVQRLERDMTVQQALSAGGGLNLRGTLRGMSITRRGPSGDLVTTEVDLSMRLRPDDVVFVKESVF